jgi:hypothetical protein
MNQRGNLPSMVLERVTRDRLDFIIVALRSYRKLRDIVDTIPTPPQSHYYDVPHARSEIEVLDGHAIVRHIYEGLMQSHSPDKKVYEFVPSFDEVPIQSHPNFDGLRDKYGGYFDANGNFRWPSQKRERRAGQQGGFAQMGQSSAGRRLTGGGPERGVEGPLGAGEVRSMQGVDAFLRMGGTYRISYAIRQESLPASLFQGVGTVSSNPPDSFRLPGIPRGRNWLKGPPTARYRGNAWDVTEEYIMSGLGGWNKDVYDGSTEG